MLKVKNKQICFKYLLFRIGKYFPIHTLKQSAIKMSLEHNAVRNVIYVEITTKRRT